MDKYWVIAMLFSFGGCTSSEEINWASIYEGCSQVFEVEFEHGFTRLVVYPPVYESRWFKKCQGGECLPPVKFQTTKTAARIDEIIIPVAKRKSSETEYGWDCEGDEEYISWETFIREKYNSSSRPYSLVTEEGVTYEEVDMK